MLFRSPDGKIWIGLTRVNPATMQIDGTFSWNESPNLPPGPHGSYAGLIGVNSKGDPYLTDFIGSYIIGIDVETGESEEFSMPFPQKGDCPFTSILSSRNRFCTHFNEHFVEFDPAKRAFTFSHQTVPRMAMGMTEDDDGGIWAVSYPDSGVMRYDPESGDFRDFGHVYQQNWQQYQRYVAADDAGWLYFGVGSTACQIIAVDPDSGQARQIGRAHV